MSYKNIAKLRKEKNITQEELAKAVGLSGQAVSKWESGGSPDIEMLAPIADYFGVSIDSLFDRKINDYANFDSAIENSLIEIKDPAEKSKKAFEYCSVIRRSVTGDPTITSQDGPITASINYTRDCIIYISDTYEKKYFFMIPEISQGIREMLEFKEEYIKLFEALSNTDVLKALLYLLVVQTSTFTTKLLEKNFNISFEKAQDIIHKLESIGMIISVDTELDGEVKQSNRFTHSHSFIPFLLFANNLTSDISNNNKLPFPALNINNPFLDALMEL